MYSIVSKLIVKLKKKLSYESSFVVVYSTYSISFGLSFVLY